MARTVLFSRLQQAASVAAEATTHHVSTSQVLAECAERRVSRRDLLKLAGAAGLTAGVSALGAQRASAAGSPRIVVVGAGLAGLTCAYRLKQAGYAATVYEASSRIGGRCWTIRGAFADRQIAEHGGGALHLRSGHQRPEDDLAADPLGRVSGELPHPLYGLHTARRRARPHVGTRLDRPVRPRRVRLQAGAAPRQPAARKSSSPSSNWSCPASAPGTTGAPPLTTGLATSGRAGPIPIGRSASTPSSPGLSASRRVAP
jgi:hypothetical protein